MSDDVNDLGSLVEITTKAPEFTINYSEAKKALEDHLKKYRIVVHSDNVKDAKRAAAEVNKLANDLDERRKGVGRQMRDALQPFDHQMRELISLCQTSNTDIKNQVAVYEDERLKACERMLLDRRDECRVAAGVRAEWHKAEIDGIVKLGSLTASDNLTKGAKDEVQRLVERDEVGPQRLHDQRLKEIEIKSLRAGLATPVELESAFISVADDDKFQQALQTAIDRAMDREAAARRHAEEQAQARQAADERVSRQESPQGELPATPSQAPSQAADPEPQQPAPTPAREAGERPATRNVMLMVAIPITVPGHVEDEQIKELAQQMILNGGFSGVASMEIHEDDE